MIYFLTNGINNGKEWRTLERLTLAEFRQNMVDELGYYTQDLTIDELIDEAIKHYESSNYSYVASNKKNTVEVLTDWGLSQSEIKKLFDELGRADGSY